MAAPTQQTKAQRCDGDYTVHAATEDPRLPLYQHQADLPRLPVPPLEATLELYLRSVQPFLSEQQLERTRAAVAEFAAPGGLGEALQARLEQRAAARGDSSWLAEWWNHLAYLRVPDPITVFCSYFFHFKPSLCPQQASQAGRAAALCVAAMHFRRAVQSGELPQQVVGRKPKQTPLCSTAMKYMFNACRVPHEEHDYVLTYPPQGNDHIAVLCRGRVFELTLGAGATVADARRQLEAVLAVAAGEDEGPGLGALTTQRRAGWARDRATLLEAAPGNAAALERVQSAAFALCLDARAPVTRTAVARELWHGDGTARFWDKSVQIVVFANAKAGLVGEHSLMDGMPMTRLADAVVTSTYRGCPAPLAGAGGVQPAVEVRFAAPAPVRAAVGRALLALEELAASHEVSTLAFRAFGTQWIKEQKMSPDAFVQMAIQYAYRKQFGCSRATYESTQTRRFLHGRTEVTRSVSVESVRWLDAMVRRDVPDADKAALLREATAAHSKYTRLAAAGRGVDRHLFGLKMLLRDGERAALFEDPVFAQSCHWNMSTSQLSHELFDGWGWGEVVPDGLGIAYTLNKHMLQFNVAARRHAPTWTDEFCQHVEDGLMEMARVVVPARL